MTFLDKLIGKEGVKADVTISLTNESYYYLGLTIFVAGSVVALTSILLKNMLTK